MMLGDHGPDTTIDEDLKALGMGYLLEADACPSSAKGDDEGEDEGEDEEDKGKEEQEKDERTEVEVQSEGESKAEVAEDEIDEEFETITDMIADWIVENAPDATEEEVVEQLEGGVIEADDEGEDEDEDEEDKDKDETDPKTEAACAIISAFYTQLQEVTEDEESKPSYDDLVGVIEAMEHVIGEDAIQEVMAVGGGARAGKKIWRHGKKTKVTTGMIRAGKKKAKAAVRFAGKMASGMFKMVQKAPGRFTMKRKSAGEKRGGRKLGRHTRGEAKRKRHAKQTQRSDVDQEQFGSPITELVQNLNDLREAVQGDDSAADELVEGLRAIFETSTTFYERVAEELNNDDSISEEEKLEDPRRAMGLHLESIANDSAAVAQRIAEGESDISDAADDLKALASDLDEAMEAMKGIE